MQVDPRERRHTEVPAGPQWSRDSEVLRASAGSAVGAGSRKARSGAAVCQVVRNDVDEAGPVCALHVPMRGLCVADREAEARVAQVVELEESITATEVDPLTFTRAHSLPMTGPKAASRAESVL
jgi:hypothetical protein